MLSLKEHDLSIIYPGRILEYFPETQTATVKISSEVFYDTSDNIDEIAERTKLHNVPVHTPSGGGWAVTFPIKEGNSCVLIFSQEGYDHWLYDDSDTAGLDAGRPSPWLKREFSEDDGFALVGFNTLPQAIQSYSATASQWRNNDATQVISLNPDNSIDITSNAPVTINCTAATVNSETVAINATSSATITSPKTTIDGDCDVTGILTAGGVQVNGHKHKAGTPPGDTGIME